MHFLLVNLADWAEKFLHSLIEIVAFVFLCSLLYRQLLHKLNRKVAKESRDKMVLTILLFC